MVEIMTSDIPSFRHMYRCMCGNNYRYDQSRFAHQNECDEYLVAVARTTKIIEINGVSLKAQMKVIVQSYNHRSEIIKPYWSPTLELPHRFRWFDNEISALIDFANWFQEIVTDSKIMEMAIEIANSECELIYSDIAHSYMTEMDIAIERYNY